MLNSNNFDLTGFEEHAAHDLPRLSRVETQEMIEKKPQVSPSEALKGSGVKAKQIDSACQFYFQMSYAQCRKKYREDEISKKNRRKFKGLKMEWNAGRKIESDG